jgi:hypothetical protein
LFFLPKPARRKTFGPGTGKEKIQILKKGGLDLDWRKNVGKNAWTNILKCEKNAWSRYRSNFGFGGMGLDREKNVVKKICGPMEFIFRRCSPPTPVWVFFFTPEKFLNPALVKYYV